MGIPSYFSYIIKNYKHILTSHLNTSVKHLYMDCNSILYDIYHKLNTTEVDIHSPSQQMNIQQLCDEIIQQIELYISTIQPTGIVFIAFDGVAPFAKIQQQRSRRFKTAAAAAASVTAETEFSTLMFTPGTHFMYYLMSYLQNHFWDKNKYILSSSQECGEGEQKIFAHLRECGCDVENDTIAIYGLDADLIMLSIHHLTFCKNLVVFREIQLFHDLKKNINNGDDDTKYGFLHIKHLYNAICSVVAPCEISIYDYTFLCFFMGNDFLPHFPALNIRTNGIDIILNCYKSAAMNISGFHIINPNTGLIQWRNVKKILDFIAKQEHHLFIELHKQRNGMEKRYKYQTNVDMELQRPIISRELEHYICPDEEGWESRYYRVLFDGANGATATAVVRNICINFLEGLEWTTQYYSGNCIDWGWSYQYHYPPLLQDLIAYIPCFETRYFPRSNTRLTAMKPATQLGIVIPQGQWQQKLLPQCVKEIVNNYYTITDTCNENLYLWAYCRYGWESHVDLQTIKQEMINDLEELE